MTAVLQEVKFGNSSALNLKNENGDIMTSLKFLNQPPQALGSIHLPTGTVL